MNKNIIKSILKIVLLGIFILGVFLISNASSCNSDNHDIIENANPLVSDEVTEVTDDSLVVTQSEEAVMYVYLCGAVIKPGVYELPSGSRVYEAINMAGGLREDALVTSINLAAFLEDASKIYIPTVDEVQVATDISGQVGYDIQTGDYSSASGLVNINYASVDELQTLKGIGPKLAMAIVEYRDSNGAFATIEDIKKVSGIGNGVFAKIENDITVQ